MSQWTHVLGVVRFDAMAQNCLPEPPNKVAILKADTEFVERLFQQDGIPAGSEGPIECQVIMTDRGPTVLLTGDLRDYGKEDLPEIVNWLNAITKQAHEDAVAQRRVVWLRDAIVWCEVEYDKTTYLIGRDRDSKEVPAPFQLFKHS